MHLRSDPRSAADLASAELSSGDIIAPDYYRFSFSPLNDSLGKTYYLVLALQSAGEVRVGRAPGGTYLEGAMYQNGQPVDAQAGFRLVYAPADMILGWSALGINWLKILGASIFLLVIPGWSLLMLVWPAAGAFSLPEKVGLSSGLSIALYPLLLLWSDLVSLHPGPLFAWLPGAIGLALILWRNRSWRPTILSATWKWRQPHPDLPDIALVIVAGLVLFVRFWIIRSVDMPLWGDSFQHTMIAQLIVDNGGLFDSWKPYADLQTFTYHFGFHSVAAAFHWITLFDMPQAVLWIGQVLNGLAALTLYPLTLRVSGSKWAGVFAVLIAGLLASMPMSYANWGRYTQLTGQVVLPVAVTLIWLALESVTPNWRLTLLASVALGGLALTHYRVLIFASLFVPAAFLLLVWKRGRYLISVSVCMTAAAWLLFLPWFIHTFSGKLPQIYGQQLTTSADANPEWIREYNGIGDILNFLPLWLWVLLLLSIAWALWRRKINAQIVGLWWLLILVAANPQWLHLPGEGVLSNFAVLIAAYIPASVLVGSAAGDWVDKLPWAKVPWGKTVLLLIVTLAGLWGSRQRLTDLQVAKSALVTDPDLRAAEWIKKNTPSDAVFLVNSFFAYGGTDVVGSDAGWWLPLLAGRSTTVPPLNYESEMGPRPDYREWINNLVHEIETRGIADPEVLAILREHRVTHIYIGQQNGRVNYGGPYVLEPEQLLSVPAFHPVYHEDRVWVFEVSQ
ncbi:MAG: hypothetical protein M1570_05915 [Chloroflexi bacterium]|nr:hypothetical protein [Chloroflexota bacterium]